MFVFQRKKHRCWNLKVYVIYVRLYRGASSLRRKIWALGIDNDLWDVVKIVYLLIDLFTIFDTAYVETPVFLAISAMWIPYSEKSLIAIQNRTLACENVYMVAH